MVRVAVALGVVVLGVAAVAVAAPSAPVVARSCATLSDYVPSWSPDGRAILFMRERNHGAISSVYAIGANARHERRVSGAAEYAYGGVWSPDGRRIAYSTFDVAAVVRIVVARADGAAARVVASFQDQREPPTTFLSWSRDGSWVAYVDSANNLVAADADGRVASRLLARGATQPAWSPNGRQLAYVGPSGITVADADGSNPRPLVQGAYPMWSPDSLRIAYTSVSGVGVHVMNADGSGARLVDPRGSFASWQANGRALIDVTVSQRVHGAVRIVDLRSSRIRTVTHDASPRFGSDNSQAVGSPSGRTIAFVSTPGFGGSEIRLVRSDGRTERRLTYHCMVVPGGSGSRMYGTWLPDLILARNKQADTIICGRGHDVVYADPGDRVRDCETVRRRPAAFTRITQIRRERRCEPEQVQDAKPRMTAAIRIRVRSPS